MTILERKMEEIGLRVGEDHTLSKEDCSILEDALTRYIEHLDDITFMLRDRKLDDLGFCMKANKARDLRDILESCFEIRAVKVGVMK